jgi:hypothetical protein
MYTALGPFLSFCISFTHLKGSINYNMKEFVPPFPIHSRNVSDVFMSHPTIIWTGVLQKAESSGVRRCSFNLLNIFCTKTVFPKSWKISFIIKKYINNQKGHFSIYDAFIHKILTNMFRPTFRLSSGWCFYTWIQKYKWA